MGCVKKDMRKNGGFPVIDMTANGDVWKNSLYCVYPPKGKGQDDDDDGGGGDNL